MADQGKKPTLQRGGTHADASADDGKKKGGGFLRMTSERFLVLARVKSSKLDESGGAHSISKSTFRRLHEELNINPKSRNNATMLRGVNAVIVCNILGSLTRVKLDAERLWVNGELCSIDAHDWTKDTGDVHAARLLYRALGLTTGAEWKWDSLRDGGYDPNDCSNWPVKGVGWDELQLRLVETHGPYCGRENFDSVQHLRQQWDQCLRVGRSFYAGEAGEDPRRIYVYRRRLNGKGDWGFDEPAKDGESSEKESVLALISGKELSRVMDRCSHIMINGKRKKITQKWRDRLEEAHELLGRAGERATALAQQELDPEQYPEGFEFHYGGADDCNFPGDSGYTFLGLLSCVDELRSRLREAVATAHRHKIQLIFSSGTMGEAYLLRVCRDIGHIKEDDLCVEEIAREGGVKVKEVDPDDASVAVLNGYTLSDYSSSDLDRIVSTKHVVLVRMRDVTPFVRALQNAGKTVAVLGGHFDMAAMEQADVGMSWGVYGSSQSKDAADLVVLDDSFSTMMEAIDLVKGDRGSLLHRILHPRSGRSSRNSSAAMIAAYEEASSGESTSSPKSHVTRQASLGPREGREVMRKEGQRKEKDRSGGKTKDRSGGKTREKKERNGRDGKEKDRGKRTGESSSPTTKRAEDDAAADAKKARLRALQGHRHSEKDKGKEKDEQPQDHQGAGSSGSTEEEEESTSEEIIVSKKRTN